MNRNLYRTCRVTVLLYKNLSFCDILITRRRRVCLHSPEKDKERGRKRYNVSPVACMKSRPSKAVARQLRHEK